MSDVFLDTSYAITLAAPTDQYHQRALELADELEAIPRKLVTTRAVLLEIGNALSRQRYRAAGVQLLQALQFDPNVNTVSLSDELFDKACALYIQRPDKEWGLIDCVSFVVMGDLGLTDAQTADEHFTQAGFRAMLRE